MTDSLSLHCSDDLFKSLIEASNCSFILLALRRQCCPLELSTIASFLSLNLNHASRLVNMLVQFGLVNPVENSAKYEITPAGVDLLSSQPADQPWNFEPSLGLPGDRLPTYVAFDILPLRIYCYHRTKLPGDNDAGIDG